MFRRPDPGRRLPLGYPLGNVGRFWDRSVGFGEPLLLLHGIGSTHDDFVALGPRLDAEYRVLAPDLPGHGHSAPLTGNDTVDGTVGGVTLRHSAYTWLAMHKPVRTTVRALTRPLTALAGRVRPNRTSPVLTAARRASRPTAAGRSD